MSDVGDGGFGIGGELGPMSGSELSKADIEALKKMGIFQDATGAFKYGYSGDLGGGVGRGTGIMDFGERQGKTSGSGSGSTAGIGASSPQLSSSGTPASSYSGYSGGNSGSFSSGGQAPHDVPRLSQGNFGTAELKAGVVPGGIRDGLVRSFNPQTRNYLADLEYIFPRYSSGMASQEADNLRPATNFLEQLRRSRGLG